MTRPSPAALPPLYAVVDDEACTRAGRQAAAVAAAFIDAGVTLLQIRGKAMAARALLELSAAVVGRGPKVRVVVNDRPDVAVLAGAAGVHVGQDDLAVADVRQIVGGDRWVGLSTHSLEQARAALDEDITYLAVGPVYETGTKSTGYAAVGLDLVQAVAALARRRGVPVVGIGGITLERAPGVLAAGASTVCVISDLLRGDPRARAGAFLARFAQG